MPIQSYRDLEAWKIGMNLVVAIYGLTKRFPREELYGLTSQLRRAAVSIPSNIGEGHQPSAALRKQKHNSRLQRGCGTSMPST